MSEKKSKKKSERKLQKKPEKKPEKKPAILVPHAKKSLLSLNLCPRGHVAIAGAKNA
jgi:hypothetical protein